ncbi:MAG: hypothetical protein ACRD0P_03155 [Stackebrandtia sp.]
MRFRAIVAVGLSAAALLTVSACRVEQGAALFVADERISEQRVDEVVNSIPEKTRKDMANYAQLSGGAMPNISIGALRGFVIDALATTAIGKRIQEETDREPDKSAADVAEANWASVGVKPGTEFVELAAEAAEYRPLLLTGAENQKPTKDEIDDLTEQFVLLGGQSPSKAERKQLRANVSELLNNDKPQEIVKGEPVVGQELVGKWRQVDKYIEKYEVSANPRYGESFIVFQSFESTPLIAFTTNLSD